MSSFKALTALAFLSLAITANAAPCNGVWVPNTSGNWSTGFTPCIPNALGDTATFKSPSSGPVAVNQDINPTATIGILNFQNPNTYTISGSNTITFDNGGSSFLNNLEGHHVINTAVNINDALTVIPNAGTILDLFNNIGVTSSMNWVGAGDVNLINTRTSATSGGSCTGIGVNGVSTFNGCNFNLINQADLTDTVGFLFGASYSTNADFILNSGSITILNNGNIDNESLNPGDSCVGAFLNVSNGGNDVIVNGGTLSLLSPGNIKTVVGPAVGSNVVAQFIRVNGGTVYVGDRKSGLESFNGTLVNGGLLINNGFIGVLAGPDCVIVGPQGTLAGNGVIAGGIGVTPTNVTNNGTVIPGIPDPVPGTLTIVGTYTQSSSGTLLSNILNINSYGQISATDSATIAGTLDLYGVSGIKVKPGDAFKVVTTTNGLTGTFSTVKMLNTPYIPMVFYFPNFVEVILNAGTYPALYQSVFASINHKNIRLEREMQNLHKRFPKEEVSPKQVAKSRMFSSRQGPTIAAINLGSQPLSQAAPMHTERQQERLHREMEYCNNNPWNVYFGPIGSVGEVHRKGFNAGFDEWSAGALAGFDYAFEEVGVGLLAEYERLHGNVHRNWGKFNIDQVEASFYSTYVPQSVPELAVNGIIGGGYEGSHILRNTGMTGNSVAQGNPNGWEVDALFGLEYAVSSKQVQEFSDNFTFTPMVNLQYVYVHFPKYKEHGAGIFDLSVSSLHAQSLRSTLGAWFNYLWQWTDLSINLEADVGWQREYFDRGSSIKFAGVSSSTLKTRGAGRNTCLAGLDLFFTLFKTYGIEASYDFEWNKMFHDHSFYLGFNIEF